MSAFILFSIFSILSYTFAAPSSSLSARQNPGGSVESGWTGLPQIAGSTLHRDWPMKGATFVSTISPYPLTGYLTNDYYSLCI